MRDTEIRSPSVSLHPRPLEPTLGRPSAPWRCLQEEGGHGEVDFWNMNMVGQESLRLGTRKQAGASGQALEDGSSRLSIDQGEGHKVQLRTIASGQHGDWAQEGIPSGQPILQTCRMEIRHTYRAQEWAQ